MVRPERIERLTQTFCRTCCVTGIVRLSEWRRSYQGVTFLRLRLCPTAHEREYDAWTDATLRAALDVVARHYRVIPIDEAIRALRRERMLPASAVVLVTSLTMRCEQVDLPKVLSQAEVPCAVYVAPGLLERGVPPWPIMIRLALEKLPGGSVDMYGRRWPLTNPEHRRAALNDITEQLYSLPETDRLTRAEELAESWGVGLDALPGLKWYETESLARSEWITFGSAGLTGDSLVRLPLDRAIYEIREARALLRERLGAAASHFAYPWADTSTPVEEQVALAGYVSALAGGALSDGMNRPGTNLYTLVSCPLKPGTPEKIRADLAGITEYLRPLKRFLS